MSDKEHPGIKALRRILTARRWDDQGGYVDVDADGKHRGFVWTKVGDATPKEMDALFDLVGVKPDPIVPLGDCTDCVHSGDGRERGYAYPCVNCTRPRMSLFQLRPKGQPAYPRSWRTEHGLWTTCPCPQCQEDVGLGMQRPNRHAPPDRKP